MIFHIFNVQGTCTSLFDYSAVFLLIEAPTGQREHAIIFSGSATKSSSRGTCCSICHIQGEKSASILLMCYTVLDFMFPTWLLHALFRFLEMIGILYSFLLPQNPRTLDKSHQSCMSLSLEPSQVSTLLFSSFLQKFNLGVYLVKLLWENCLIWFSYVFLMC